MLCSGTPLSRRLQQDLGESFSELEIEHDAFAAASLAQVHRATATQEGIDLALKVQYPGIAQAIDGDFDSVISHAQTVSLAQNRPRCRAIHSRPKSVAQARSRLHA